MREALEQTRYTRSRPAWEQAEGLEGRIQPMDPWVKIILEFSLGLLLAAGILMAFAGNLI